MGPMSCLFEVDDAVVWSPSNTVGRLFKGEVDAVASAFRVPAGLGDIIEDECVIDLPVFESFLAEATQQFDRTTHPILRSLTVSVIATASVLVERAGGHLPDTEPERAAAWTQLRAEHGRSMPR
jgi:Family of unknown function (DUF6086)